MLQPKNVRILHQMAGTLYKYVGPADIPSHRGEPLGVPVRTSTDLQRALEQLGEPGGCTLTYVVDRAGVLLVAGRHSEHVNCAGGEPVLSAGEITVERTSDSFQVTDITNQSTGYCPEPSSWGPVEAAIPDEVARPDYWTAEFTFRRCPKCLSINIVKEGYFFCGVCEGPLPEQWNF